MSLRMIPEWRSLAEMNCLLFDPVFYGVGVPAGDGKPVVLIPGFMEGDGSLALLARWLQRVGYRPALAGVLLNWLSGQDRPRRSGARRSHRGA